MSLAVQNCTACGAQHYPPRLRCPVCGRDAFIVTEVEGGRVEASTTLRHVAGRFDIGAVVIGVVALAGGARVVARFTQPSPDGTDMRLSIEEQAVIAAPAGQP